MNLVFVCTGNICRSPMAEGMFKKLLEEKDEQIDVLETELNKLKDEK